MPTTLGRSFDLGKGSLTNHYRALSTLRFRTAKQFHRRGGTPVAPVVFGPIAPTGDNYMFDNTNRLLIKNFTNGLWYRLDLVGATPEESFTWSNVASPTAVGTVIAQGVNYQFAVGGILRLLNTTNSQYYTLHLVTEDDFTTLRLEGPFASNSQVTNPVVQGSNYRIESNILQIKNLSLGSYSGIRFVETPPADVLEIY